MAPTSSPNTIEQEPSVKPLCPVFGSCGGCAFQNIDYETEIALKEEIIRTLFNEVLNISGDRIHPFVRSPQPYHYRNRLDLTIRRLKSGEIIFGFQHQDSRRMIEIDACSIARPEISEFLPKLRAQASEKLPENYHIANLSVKTGDDGRIFWGGIGRRSLVLQEKDYLWTDINRKRIFYSLDTFFQSNLSILPDLMKAVASRAGFDANTDFLDLYAGVGLFGIYFADQVHQVFAIEESAASAKLMEYNRQHHRLTNFQILSAKVETILPELLASGGSKRKVAMIDPPRRGLSPEILLVLAASKKLDSLLYLSCSLESLVRDLKQFLNAGWKIEAVIPFDFFPKTPHQETLVGLKPC